MRGTPVLLAAALLLAACRSGAGRSAPQECSPVAGPLAPGVSGASLAGEYRIRLVATSGEGRGSTVGGTLSLTPAQPEYRRRSRPGGGTDSTHRYPLTGGADLDLGAVGAVAPGGAASEDPAHPGVLVIERVGVASDTPGRIMLRLGSEANRPDVVRFDGGYTVLRVRHADEAGFAGEWESGTPMPRAAGHFCAVRQDG